MTKDLSNKLRQQAIDAAIAYYHHQQKSSKPFSPGDMIHYAGRVYDQHEIANLIDSSLEFWLTTGFYAQKLEKQLADFLNIKYCSLVNSGSSANLIAFMALTSPQLGARRINPGDEVITVAAAFPTTVAPIIQYGAIPVFVDVSLPSYNLDVRYLEEALSVKTKAVMVAHTLGNPFDLTTVIEFCRANKLWLIEDNCDALGSKACMDGTWHFTGTLGDIGTSSFYPPHHMTMGEGGAVYTNNPDLKRIIDSLRDWGRDCWCGSGKDNSCGKRFDRQFGELPYGYDHKYVYSHFGYNLKVTDMQAAIGCAQLDKLPGFIDARKKNWGTLKNALSKLDNIFVLPESSGATDPSWFGFALTVNENTGITRDGIVQYLESQSIQTRMLFSGNLIKHPCFDEMRAHGNGYRVISSLQVTDRIMRDTFWIGVYPGLTDEMLTYVIENIKKYVFDRRLP